MSEKHSKEKNMRKICPRCGSDMEPKTLDGAFGKEEGYECINKECGVIELNKPVSIGIGHPFNIWNRNEND